MSAQTNDYLMQCHACKRFTLSSNTWQCPMPTGGLKAHMCPIYHNMHIALNEHLATKNSSGFPPKVPEKTFVQLDAWGGGGCWYKPPRCTVWYLCSSPFSIPFPFYTFLPYFLILPLFFPLPQTCSLCLKSLTVLSKAGFTEGKTQVIYCIIKRAEI